MTSAPLDEGYDDEMRPLAGQPLGGSVARVLADVRGWPDEQRLELINSLLGIMSSASIAHIAHEIYPRLYRDFIGDLPAELAVHILSNLDAQTLCRISRVSRRWQELTSYNQLW
ncbi:hypothetical protein THASP1DRAFT_31788, partial [Thamnocephalis sphaerospora]